MSKRLVGCPGRHLINTGSPVAVFTHQIGYLAGVFASPQVNTPNFAGDRLGYLHEFDPPDALVGREVAVRMGEDGVGGGLIGGHPAAKLI
jgi:hypothetical protein